MFFIIPPMKNVFHIWRYQLAWLVSLFFIQKIYMKEVKIIKQISKQEAFAMRKILGTEQVKQSRSRYPKYYLVESKQNLAELFKFQKSKILEKHF